MSGNPQELVSGPMLLIIYISDLDTGFNSDICKFADDLKIAE